MLREARPTALADQDLTLAWPESAAFSKRQAEEPAKRELIAQSIRAVTGASLRLAYELGAEHEAPAARLRDDELVERFKREFEAEELPPPTEES
jgi:DNA polymerase III subunit gamma/tau